MTKKNYSLQCSKEAYEACWKVVEFTLDAFPKYSKVNHIKATDSCIEIELEYHPNCYEVGVYAETILAPYV